MSIEIEYFGMLDTPPSDLGLFELDPLLLEPMSAIKFIRSQTKLDTFKCPAFTNYLKNVYYILSPFDFTIINKGTHYSIINDRDPEIDLSRFLIVQFPETQLLNNQPMLSILLQYTFLNKKNNLSMEVIDPPLVSDPLTNVCGEFNISKWTRPTNFCFFLNSDCQSISFKRGDPLYAVKFITEKNTKLKLITDDDRRMRILSEQQRAGSIKKWYPKLNLEQCYDLFVHRIRNVWK